MLASPAPLVDEVRFGDRAVWEVLLHQAKANQATAEAILLRTQREVCALNTTATEPERLEQWYCADGDAHDVATIARQVVKTASPPSAGGGIGSKRVNPVTMPRPCKILPSGGTPLPGDTLPNIVVGAGEGPSTATGANALAWCPTPNARTEVPTANGDTGDNTGADFCTVAYDIFSSGDEDEELTDHDALEGRPSMPFLKLSGD